MRLRWPFGVSQPDLEQPERDLLAPVRDLYEPCDVHQAWWTAHLLLDGARRPVVPSTVRRPHSDRGRVSGASAPACGAPRARAHQRRPRHHAPNVFTACDQDYHVAGGSHVALLRHHGAQRRRRCNTGTGFRSTCGAAARAKEPGWSCERPWTSVATSACW